MRSFVSSLRFRLLGLVLLVLALPVGLALHTYWADRQREIAGWKPRCLEIVQFAEREEAELISSTRQLLVTLAQLPQVRSGDRAACQALFNDLIKQTPRYSNWGLAETNGDVSCTARPLLEAINVADRSYFSDALRTRGFSVGAYQIDRVTGLPTCNFGYPVLDESGRVQAVIAAALDLDWLNRFEMSVKARLPAGSTWTKTDQSGVILVRLPEPVKWVGKSLPIIPLLNAIATNETGLVEAPDSDGMSTLFVFTSMRSPILGKNISVVLGIPKRVMFAEANRTLVRNLAGLGLVGFWAFGVGGGASDVFILRGVETLVSSTARLAAGDLGARTGRSEGGSELDQLMRSFDGMAAALEQREAERKNAEEELRQLSGRLLQAHDEERRRIGRELHDNAAQWLAALSMNLTALAHSAIQLDPKAKTLLDESLRLLEQCSLEVRTVSYLLHPPLLEELGLEGAMDEYVNEFAQRSGIRVAIELPPDLGRLPAEVELALFRVLQECLINVYRHSGSSTATVRLMADDTELRLEVIDAGHGMPRPSPNEATGGAAQGRLGVGITGMRERLRQLGGRLEIDSTGHGTTIRARMPLPKAEV